MENAAINLKTNKLDFTPKARVDVSGYKVGRYYDGEKDFPINAYGGDGNIDLSISLNFEIPIFNSDSGIFNSINYKEAKLDHREAIETFKSTKNELKNFVNEKYSALREIKLNLKNSGKRQKQDFNILNKLTKGFGSNIVKRDQLRDALERSFRNTRNLLQLKIDYLESRVEVAKELGNLSFLGINCKSHDLI